MSEIIKQELEQIVYKPKIEQTKAISFIWLLPLAILGLLRTMFDRRSTLSQQVSAQLNQHFGAKVLETCIPRNVRLAEAPSHGLPALAYDRTSSGAKAYIALAAELVNRLSLTHGAP